MTFPLVARRFVCRNRSSTIGTMYSPQMVSGRCLPERLAEPLRLIFHFFFPFSFPQPIPVRVRR
jgi:hypothetical protein